ncbi:MAG: hypothetical protein ACLR4Z_15980 [Butyricicoccaceae bacterium]
MIYCVEDDAGIRELVVYTAAATPAWRRDGFADGAALFHRPARTQSPTCILLGHHAARRGRHLHPAPSARSLPDTAKRSRSSC